MVECFVNVDRVQDGKWNKASCSSSGNWFGLCNCAQNPWSSFPADFTFYTFLVFVKKLMCKVSCQCVFFLLFGRIIVPPSVHGMVFVYIYIYWRLRYFRVHSGTTLQIQCRTMQQRNLKHHFGQGQISLDSLFYYLLWGFFLVIRHGTGMKLQRLFWNQSDLCRAMKQLVEVFPWAPPKFLQLDIRPVMMLRTKSQTDQLFCTMVKILFHRLKVPKASNDYQL